MRACADTEPRISKHVHACHATALRALCLQASCPSPNVFITPLAPNPERLCRSSQSAVLTPAPAPVELGVSTSKCEGELLQCVLDVKASGKEGFSQKVRSSQAGRRHGACRLHMQHTCRQA